MRDKRLKETNNSYNVAPCGRGLKPMTTNEPQVTLNGLYPVCEASKILGIDRSTLRRHTEEGLIKFTCSRANGRKRYEGRELLRYWKMNA